MHVNEAIKYKPKGTNVLGAFNLYVKLFIVHPAKQRKIGNMIYY